MGTGKVHRIFSLDGSDGSADETELFKRADVPGYRNMTDPDWEAIDEKASANQLPKKGKNLSCRLSVAREIGVLCYSGRCQWPLHATWKNGQK